MASWDWAVRVQLQPLVDAHKREMLEDRVLHADETPVAMLKPATASHTARASGATIRRATGVLGVVVFDFADGRGGQHARAFLGRPGHGRRGTLARDDFSG
ncbi:IS66 family transposase [Variovorax saccharolyticus]|uniref:IS66 family transposase n=1 Tax=Variovorax saccharolyticus TaxID=3053516 RepID=UPI002577E6FF|nr:transposase [Variovorax sp. J31P216]MDM0028327.1 transposase [Variovorax sp. J31P216]